MEVEALGSQHVRLGDEQNRGGHAPSVGVVMDPLDLGRLDRKVPWEKGFGVGEVWQGMT